MTLIIRSASDHDCVCAAVHALETLRRYGDVFYSMPILYSKKMRPVGLQLLYTIQDALSHHEHITCTPRA